MSAGRDKIGRNNPCPCGSGRKYKKCCLPLEEATLQVPAPLDNTARQESQERLKKRIQRDLGDKVILLSGELELKMSEVILHLAEDLLEFANTKAQHKKIITMTCAAWNLAVMFKPEHQIEEIEKFLNFINVKQEQEIARAIILSIIDKKNYYYPDINRVIIEHELIGSKNNLHLNVISTVPEQPLPE